MGPLHINYQFKKQNLKRHEFFNSVAMDTTDIIKLHHLLLEFNIFTDTTTPLYCDNIYALSCSYKIYRD